MTALCPLDLWLIVAACSVIALAGGIALGIAIGREWGRIDRRLECSDEECGV